MSFASTEASLFNAIDALLRKQAAIEGRDRRLGARRGYECTQLLALFDGEQLPSPAEFSATMCLDLSAGGFSFGSSERPQHQWVVVGLGQVPYLFVVAQIVHVRPAAWESPWQFLIGCRFERRLSGE